MDPKGDRARRLVEDIFATRDDEIQCADARTLMASCAVELLADEQARQRYPALATHFRFCSNCAEDYRALMTVARQEAAGGVSIPAAPARPTASESNWVAGLGFLWRRLAETGRIVVRVFGEAPPGSAFSPAVKSSAPKLAEGDVVRQLTLTPDESGDLDLKAVVRRSQKEPRAYTLAVRVQFRSRWQTLAGTPVLITAAGWQAPGRSDEEGEVVFEGIPEEDLDTLAIEIGAPTPPG
jgi:hypothetical protein